MISNLDLFHFTCNLIFNITYTAFKNVNPVIKNNNKMYETINHLNCTVDDCNWKRYHSDIDAMNKANGYMDCSVGHVNIGTARQTRLQADQNQVVVADGIKLVNTS